MAQKQANSGIVAIMPHSAESKNRSGFAVDKSRDCCLYGPGTLQMAPIPRIIDIVGGLSDQSGRGYDGT